MEIQILRFDKNQKSYQSENPELEASLKSTIIYHGYRDDLVLNSSSTVLGNIIEAIINGDPIQIQIKKGEFWEAYRSGIFEDQRELLSKSAGYLKALIDIQESLVNGGIE